VTTVSQKVPADWVVLAQQDAARVSDVMALEHIDVLINMDETFIQFYPEIDKVIAPVGAQRIGSSNATDEKKGCTVAVSMEFFSSSLLPPFVVLDGAYEGRLKKQWDNHQGALVTFQPNHWMDNVIAKQYLQWVKDLHPGKRIGIVWDKAGAHKSEQVLAFAKELGIVVDFISAGLTSIIQPCDICCNKKLKGLIRRSYYQHKSFLRLETGQKVRVDREHLVAWIEQAVSDVDSDQKRSRKIAATFRKCGLDPFDMDKADFASHLESLGDTAIYNALIQCQRAEQLID
jgi:hypothetical protein